ncbi:SH3 domain-containing protein [Chryseobacterium caseinilyticum]|uniref:SH3 domain-containing protein n=1 Tax=Chryseobacterium caseinilyticum TaxID=2771428 RepID=A0ABR8ZBC4_9FLAO|nr:SH3 domain-containing protein [Chryseobacterium caseinilyticum]MBD8082552.1 SH3 domain-containing protein [Chryseobacterium caseinilyticum]
MKPFLTTLFICFIKILFAQENEIYANGVFHFEDNKTQKIFTDHTRVRQSPDVNSQILDSLKTNQQIVILKKKENILKLGERIANWYKISYQKDNQNYEGFIWGGNLAVGFRSKNGYDFLFGLTKTVSRKNPEYDGSFPQNYASVKLLKDNRLVDEVSFETGLGESLSFGTFNVESNHRLKNVELTLKATVSGEACGIASYDQYVLVKGEKLVALPQLTTVGDADVYYHTEEFIFPNDKGGIPNAFIYKMEEVEEDEKEREKFKRSSKTYLWNGNSFKAK